MNVTVASPQLSEAVRVRDLEVPEGLKVEVDPATPIAIVEVPRALKGGSRGGGDGEEATDGAEA